MTAEQVNKSMADKIFRDAYEADWKKCRKGKVTKFYHNYGYYKIVGEPDWDWSVDFGRWGANVTFTDGWQGFTFPKQSFKYFK
jgi:hypothetical protein